MDISEIKKALAGLCIASLVSGAGLAFAASSSGGAESGGGGGDQKKEAGKTG